MLKRKLARGKVLEFFANLPACLVGLEACAAAHYWARELTKLVQVQVTSCSSGWTSGQR